MTREADRLSRMETYSGSMVLFIGLFYLVSVGSVLFQTGLHKSGLWGAVELKMLLLSLAYLSGGILLFLKKMTGWMICVATLLNYVWVVLVYVLAMSTAGSFNAFAAMAIAFFILLVLAFLFLFNGVTRRKFMVNNRTYLFTMILCALIGTVMFAL